MTKTWLADFHEKTDLNRYPTVAFRGGVGYRKPTGETVSNFVGHPVHYFHNGLWKPITLQKHANGDLEGSDFGWNGGHVTYKKRPLFQPKAVIFDGKRYNLDLKWNGSSLACDLPFGVYEVKFTEKGVKEWLTIPDPVDGLIEFDVHHENKPEGLYKKNRHIVGGDFGESFILTKDMKYPLEIDPDYAADTGDGHIYGVSGTYATARSTSSASDIAGTRMDVANVLADGGTNYYIYHSYVKFDTSGIGTDNVTQANMSLHVTFYIVSTHFDVLIAKQNWSGEDPIGAGNRETAYDGALTATLDDNIWQNTASVSSGNRYGSGDLSTSWINKTGYTYYSLQNSNARSNTPPSAVDQYIGFATQDHGTSGNRPYLTVTHSAAAVSTQVIWFS